MGLYRYVGLGVLLNKGMNAVEQAMTESGELLVSTAQGNAPVGETGNLRAGIHLESVVRSGLKVTATVATGGETDYAGYVEGGTSKMDAQPYMAPALLEVAPVAVEALARAARKEF